MPNHFNRVSFYSDNEEHIKELYDIFESGTNPYVDKTVFGQIIPNQTGKRSHLMRRLAKNTNGANHVAGR